MIVALGVFGFVFFVGLYVFAARATHRSDPEGKAVLAAARGWHDRYGLSQKWALAMSKGAQVLNLSFLFLAVASVAGVYTAAHPRSDMAFLVFLLATLCAFFVAPLAAASVGNTGRPRRWLRMGSDKVQIEDLSGS